MSRSCWKVSLEQSFSQLIKMFSIPPVVISRIFSVSILLCSTVQVAHASVSAVLPLTSSAYGTSLSLEVTIGNQTFNLLPDTGSADLWVLAAGWKCYAGQPSISGKTSPESACQFGVGTYTKSSTFEPITDSWLGEHYGAGDIVATLGYDNVEIGGISVPHQEFGMTNATNQVDDNQAVGILGLSSAALTSAHPANYSASTALQLLSNRLWYETVLNGMTKQGMDPYFAFALDRTLMDQEKGPGRWPPISLV